MKASKTFGCVRTAAACWQTIKHNTKTLNLTRYVRKEWRFCLSQMLLENNFFLLTIIVFAGAVIAIHKCDLTHLRKTIIQFGRFLPARWFRRLIEDFLRTTCSPANPKLRKFHGRLRSCLYNDMTFASLRTNASTSFRFSP